jgi:sugar phosphate isomerase/epimerase
MISLPHPTLNDLHPPDFIRIAKRTGYDALNLRIIPFRPDGPQASIFNDRALFRATREALWDTALPVLDIEVIRIEAGMRIADFRPFFDAGAQLGATYAVAIGIDAGETFVTEQLAALAAEAQPFGIRMVIEFMARGGIKTLEATQRIVTGTGRDDVGILVDSLHFYRSGATLAQLADVDPRRLPYMQINDVYNFEQLRDAPEPENVLWKKVLPGDGDLRLRELLQTLPAGIPIAVEAPGPANMSLAGAEAYARRAFIQTRAILERSLA